MFALLQRLFFGIVWPLFNGFLGSNSEKWEDVSMKFNKNLFKPMLPWCRKKNILAFFGIFWYILHPTFYNCAENFSNNTFQCY